MLILTIVFSTILLGNFLVYISIPIFFPVSDPEWNNQFTKILTLIPSLILWILFALSSIIIIFEPKLFIELSFLFLFYNIDFFVYIRIIGLIILSVGTGIVFFGRKALNRRKHDDLTTTGIFKLIRHPLYTAYCTYFISLFFIFPSILTLILLSGILGYYKTSIYEEELLINQYGSIYLNYCKTTGRLFPKLYQK